ncbi:MAG: DUF799 family lipoprotein [Gammaproteobacteria bacterium]|nr:DUF799 family lipoprotein [Gammaproteobacteria bacterium]
MKLYSVLLLSSLLLMSGCAVQPLTKGEAFPGMYGEKPTSILVIPAINHSTAADAPILYSSTINEPLSNAGYYVLPIEVTDRFLRNEGLIEGEQISEIPPQRFSEHFGADAVLYVIIDIWDTNYYVVGGNVTVGVQFSLKSTKSGETLWAYKDQLVVDTSGDSNNGGGLLGAIIATAIKTASQDYVPVARNINVIALNAIPFGKYHKAHDKDMSMNIPAAKVQNYKTTP